MPSFVHVNAPNSLSEKTTFSTSLQFFLFNVLSRLTLIINKFTRSYLKEVHKAVPSVHTIKKCVISYDIPVHINIKIVKMRNYQVANKVEIKNRFLSKITLACRILLNHCAQTQTQQPTESCKNYNIIYPTDFFLFKIKTDETFDNEFPHSTNEIYICGGKLNPLCI